MTNGRPGLVFDTSPLRHFALKGWLGVLKYLARDHDAMIPESVEIELRDQSRTEPELRQILEAGWLIIDRSTDLPYLEAFAGYERLLARGSRNRGECGVLALGKTRGHQLVIDDRVAWKRAKEDDLRCRGTLGLLCEAIREGKLTVPMVSDIADDLLSGDYRFPFGKGHFKAWAEDNLQI